MSCLDERVIGFERLNFLTPEARASLHKLSVEATIT
jgi:hypothetical protein